MDVLTASTPKEFRAWLELNCLSQSEVWLVIQHKNSEVPGIRMPEAVEQALCFGWIDGLHQKHDPTSSRLRFSPRRRRSSWSAANRARAAALTEAGLMTEHGQAVIDRARELGTWLS